LAASRLIRTGVRHRYSSNADHAREGALVSRSRVIPRLVLALGLVVSLAACGQSTPVPVPTPGPAFAKTGDGVLRIGNLYPASGQAAFLSGAQAAGVAIAVAEINAAGGVGGVPVEIDARDSADAASTTLETSFAAHLTAGVDVVIGPHSSVLAQRVIPLAVDAGIPIISPAATYPRLSALHDDGLFFRTIPSYAYQGTVLGQVVSAAGPVRVALLYLDEDPASSLEPTLRSSLEAEGSTLLAIPFTAKDTDFAPALERITKAKPDLVVLATPFSAIAQSKALITQLSAADYGGAKLWLTSQSAADYSQALPAGLLAGVNAIIDGFHPDDAFVARLTQSNPALGETRYAAEAYDATVLAALAAVVAGDDGSPAIARTLVDVSRGGTKCGSFAECLDALATTADIDYDGVTGPANFTAEGDVSPAFFGVYAYNAENKFVFASVAFGR
jgi:branched-chain amino acid transport system substrate-binding protein